MLHVQQNDHSVLATWRDPPVPAVHRCMGLNYLILFSLVSALAWWLSGFDSRLIGDQDAADLKRRLIRCGTTLLLFALAIAAASDGGRFGAFVLLALIVPLAIVWTGPLSELFARGFHHLLDSPDAREFAPEELTRELDHLADLVRQSRHGEAIQLCLKLKAAASGSGLALETTLFRLYDEMFADTAILSPALAEAQAAYDQGHCLLAESRLNQVLKQDPGNLVAGMMLMKLYAGNLNASNRALALLQALEQRRGVPPGFGDYARRRIQEKFAPLSEQTKAIEGIESMLVEKKPAQPPEEDIDLPQEPSVADLLTAGHLGTAIEKLESEIKARPKDFELRLQLAEAHGLYCCNLNRARDIVAKIESNPAFTAHQIRKAKAKLQQWESLRPAR